MKKEYKPLLAVLSFVAIVAIGVFCYFKEIRIISDFARQVNEIRQAENYGGQLMRFNFAGFFNNVAYQAAGVADELIAKAETIEYVEKCCCKTFFALVASMAIYTVLVTTFGSYFFKSLFKKGKFTLPVISIVVLTLSEGICIYLWFKSNLTITNPTLYQILAAVAALLAVIAMAEFAELLYDKFKLKTVVWAVVVIIMIAGYLFGTIAKFKLYSVDYIPSFTYVALEDLRFASDEYMDEIIWNDDGSMTFFGKTYQPENYPNTEHAFGFERGLYFAAEAVNPTAGIYNNLADLDNNSIIIPIGYCIQAVLWIVVCRLINR